MSKSCKELNSRTNPGLDLWVNLIASSCWGITVPRIEVMASRISRIIVSFTELSIFHVEFDLFFAIALKEEFRYIREG